MHTCIKTLQVPCRMCINFACVIFWWFIFGLFFCTGRYTCRSVYIDICVNAISIHFWFLKTSLINKIFFFTRLSVKLFTWFCTNHQTKDNIFKRSNSALFFNNKHVHITYAIIAATLPCVNPSGLLVLWFCRPFTRWMFAPLWYGFTTVVQSAGDSGLLFQLFRTLQLTLHWWSPPVIAIITAFQWTTDVSEIQLSKNYRKVTTFL